MHLKIETLIQALTEPQFAEESEPPPSEQITPAVTTSQGQHISVVQPVTAQQEVTGPNEPDFPAPQLDSSSTNIASTRANSGLAGTSQSIPVTCEAALMLAYVRVVLA